MSFKTRLPTPSRRTGVFERKFTDLEGDYTIDGAGWIDSMRRGTSSGARATVSKERTWDATPGSTSRD
jgi:hypothetical protein